MPKIPNRLLPAIVIPISMLVIITIGLVFYRLRKNRSTRNENSDKKHNKPYTFDDYETPYENEVYEEYMTINDRYNDYQRKTPTHSRTTGPSASPVQNSNSSMPSCNQETQTDFNFECSIEEPTPIDKPDAFLPGYIYQLEKTGRLEKIRQVLSENGNPPDPAGSQVSGNMNMNFYGLMEIALKQKS